MNDNKDLRLAVEKLYDIAQACINNGDNEEALKAYRRALDLQKSIVDETSNEYDYNILAVLLLNVALLGGTKEYEALACFKKAVDIWKKLYKDTGNNEYKNNEQAAIRRYLTGSRQETKLQELPLTSMNFNELSKIAIQLGRYDILCNDSDEILIVIPRKLPSDHNEAKFYYDGGEHGILVKNRNTVVICDGVNEGVRDLLYTRKEVLFFEKDEKLGHELEYMVPLIQCRGVETFANKLLKAINK